MKKPRIYFDSNPLLDAIKFQITGELEDERKRNLEHTKAMMEAAADGVVEIISSSLIIAECRRADREKPADEETKELIRRIVSSEEIIKLSFVTFEITEKARDLDWVHGISLRAADAIHLATAVEHDCKELFTTDRKMKAKAVEALKRFGIRIIDPSDTQLLPVEYRAGRLFAGGPKPKVRKRSGRTRKTAK